MILTVTLNAALDVTYDVPVLEEGASHRVTAVRSRAGGKGINVARVLHTFGYDVLATGFAGGVTGKRIGEDLGAAGIEHRLVTVEGESRRTVTVVSERSGDATVFNEPGPTVTSGDWQRMTAHVDDLVGAATAMVCTGSLPPGAPVDAYAQLLDGAAASRVPVIVDAEGPALLAALGPGPAVVKPNRAELVQTLGEHDVVSGAERLRELGAGTVVVSLGADGLLAVTPEGRWTVRPARRLAGNPTGAGDAAVAGLVSGLVDGLDWPQRLRRAVAWSSAAVLAPAAGDVDPEAASGLAAGITLEETRAPDPDR